MTPVQNIKGKHLGLMLHMDPIVFSVNWSIL